MNRNKRKRGDGVDSFSPYYFPSFLNLFAFFKRYRPEIVVIRPVFTTFGYRLILLSILFRSKIVFHSRIRVHRPFSSSKRILIKSLLGLFNAYWMSPCLGDPEKHPLLVKRILYFPFTIQVSQINRTYLHEGKINILCVAKYFTSKNPQLMLDVFIELRRKYHNIRLTVCGTGDENGDYFLNMKKTSEASGFQGDIDLLINHPLASMEELYLRNDIFVLPTNHDPASFTVVEAMKYGLVTITTNIDGSSGYIKHGHNGFIFPKGDTDQLRSALSSLIENEKKIEEMGRKSLRLIQEEHEPSKVTQTFLEKIVK